MPPLAFNCISGGVAWAPLALGRAPLVVCMGSLISPVLPISRTPARHQAWAHVPPRRAPATRRRRDARASRLRAARRVTMRFYNRRRLCYRASRFVGDGHSRLPRFLGGPSLAGYQLDPNVAPRRQVGRRAACSRSPPPPLITRPPLSRVTSVTGQMHPASRHTLTLASIRLNMVPQIAASVCEIIAAYVSRCQPQARGLYCCHRQTAPAPLTRVACFVLIIRSITSVSDR